MPKKTKPRDSAIWTTSDLMAIAMCAGCDVRTVRRYLDTGTARAPNSWRIPGVMRGERYRAVLLTAQEVLSGVAIDELGRAEKGGAK